MKMHNYMMLLITLVAVNSVAINAQSVRSFNKIVSGVSFSALDLGNGMVEIEKLINNLPTDSADLTQPEYRLEDILKALLILKPDSQTRNRLSSVQWNQFVNQLQSKAHVDLTKMTNQTKIKHFVASLNDLNRAVNTVSSNPVAFMNVYNNFILAGGVANIYTQEVNEAIEAVDTMEQNLGQTRGIRNDLDLELNNIQKELVRLDSSLKLGLHIGTKNKLSSKENEISEDVYDLVSALNMTYDSLSRGVVTMHWPIGGPVNISQVIAQELNPYITFFNDVRTAMVTAEPLKDGSWLGGTKQTPRYPGIDNAMKPNNAVLMRQLKDAIAQGSSKLTAQEVQEIQDKQAIVTLVNLAKIVGIPQNAIDSVSKGTPAEQRQALNQLIENYVSQNRAGNIDLSKTQINDYNILKKIANELGAVGIDLVFPVMPVSTTNQFYYEKIDKLKSRIEVRLQVLDKQTSNEAELESLRTSARLLNITLGYTEEENAEIMVSRIRGALLTFAPRQ